MNKKEIITSFVDARPAVVGAYGYGSGVFRQAGYEEEDIPQIDLIFLVDNLKEWHKENMKYNRDDYSLLGRIHVNVSSLKRLKGSNGITYYSQIFENGYRFKYGVMEEQDFLLFLNSWENFFIAGRFHKPILQILRFYNAFSSPHLFVLNKYRKVKRPLNPIFFFVYIPICS